MICYGEMPYAQERGFDDREIELVEKGAIPEMAGYNAFGCTGQYYSDGSFYEIYVLWQNVEDGNYKQLTLTISPADAEDAETRDGAIVPNLTGITKTEVDGIEVTGIGTPKTEGRHNVINCLIFEKNGMRYQIYGLAESTLKDICTVMEFYLKQDVDLSAFHMENGDQYGFSTVAEHPEAFPGCFPDVTGLPFAVVSDSMILKNGAPDSAELCYYYYDNADHVEGCIFYCISGDTEEENLGQLRNLTEERILEELLENREINFLLGEYRIHIVCGNGDDDAIRMLLLLLKTVTDFPEEQETVNAEEYFNAAQQGQFNWAFCGNGTEKHQLLFFQEQLGGLLEGGVIPAIPGTELSELCGYYYPEDELCLVFMSWGEVWVYIYPPETELWDSWYDAEPEKCTQTVVNGVTIYGDGNADGLEKALFFSLEDGSNCYIVTMNSGDAEVMVTLANHFANNGVDYDAFSFHKGDQYEYVGLSDPRAEEYLKGCYPDTEDILIVNVEIRNGEIQKAIIGYEVHPGRSVTWAVLPESPDTVENWINDIPFLTEEDVLESLNHEGDSAMTYINERYIRITVSHDNLADEVWEMIKGLQ